MLGRTLVWTIAASDVHEEGARPSHGFVNPHDIEQMWRDQVRLGLSLEMDYTTSAIHPDVSGRPQVLME